MCLKVDPKERLSANDLLECDLLKRRNSLKDQLNDDSVNLNNSGSYSCKIIGKISVRRRDFKNIKEMLPKNKFGDHSVDKVMENKSMCNDKNKENTLNFVNSNKITRKDVLPTIKRSTSLKSRQDPRIKVIEEKILC